MGAAVADAVQEERGRAPGPARGGAGLVLADAGVQGLVAHVGVEPLEVEAARGGVLAEVVGLEPGLVGEQLVVHLPESALPRGCLGRDGGEIGVGVHVLQRQVPHDVPHAVAEVGGQLGAHAGGPRAERALEIEVLDHGVRGVLVALHVVALGVDGGGEGDG